MAIPTLTMSKLYVSKEYEITIKKFVSGSNWMDRAHRFKAASIGAKPSRNRKIIKNPIKKVIEAKANFWISLRICFGEPFKS